MHKTFGVTLAGFQDLWFEQMAAQKTRGKKKAENSGEAPEAKESQQQLVLTEMWNRSASPDTAQSQWSSRDEWWTNKLGRA